MSLKLDPLIGFRPRTRMEEDTHHAQSADNLGRPIVAQRARAGLTMPTRPGV